MNVGTIDLEVGRIKEKWRVTVNGNETIQIHKQVKDLFGNAFYEEMNLTNTENIRKIISAMFETITNAHMGNK